MGLLIGLLLALSNLLLQLGSVPILTRSALIVACWIGITGGLHLDGAMDTADGLSVTDKERQLAVMKDSATGAFGAIAAVIILLLKRYMYFQDGTNHIYIPRLQWTIYSL